MMLLVVTATVFITGLVFGVMALVEGVLNCLANRRAWKR